MAGDERVRSDLSVIAALAALFWKCIKPVRLWSNQKPSQRTEVEGVIDWPPNWMGEKGAGDLCLQVSQWITSVFSGAKGTWMDAPWVVRESNAAISLREFCSYDVEATVKEKSSTYDRRKDIPSRACSGAT